MDWASFKTKARELNNQLPSVRQSVLSDEAASEALDKVRGLIAKLRFDLDELRFSHKRDSQIKVPADVSENLGKALDDARECLERFGPMLEDATDPKRIGMRGSRRRQLGDLASERTKTYAAITNLNVSLSAVLDYLSSCGIPSGRTRRSEVRATVTDRKSPDHRKLA